MPSAPSTSFIRPDEFWQSVGLRAGQKIVHFGCGAGFYLIPAARLVGKDGRVIGIDLMANMLSEVESRARREGVGDIVRTVRANLELRNGSTLLSGSADLVLLANILHQSDPEKILAEARRILVRGGCVVVVEWAVTATPLGPPHDKRVTSPDMQAVAVRLGLKLEKEFSPSPYHYGLVFRN